MNMTCASPCRFSSAKELRGHGGSQRSFARHFFDESTGSFLWLVEAEAQDAALSPQDLLAKTTM